MPPPHVQVHTKLRELRQQYGLTQEQLAEHVGITRTTIIYLEAGTYLPSLALATRFSQLFNLSIEEIFQITDPTWSPATLA
jgi:putative transcriptional regulator